MIAFIDVENNHSADLVYGILTVPQGQTVRVFDLTDYATYGLATFLMYKYFTELYNDFKNGIVKISTDEGLFTEPHKIDELHSWFAPVSNEHKVGFYDASIFYFDLIRRRWVVKNPLDGKKYAVPMVPWEELDG